MYMSFCYLGFVSDGHLSKWTLFVEVEVMSLCRSLLFEFFQIAYVCEHTREHCSKLARDLLAMVVLHHPFVISQLLQCTGVNMDKIGLVRRPIIGQYDDDGDVTLLGNYDIIIIIIIIITLFIHQIPK